MENVGNWVMQDYSRVLPSPNLALMKYLFRVMPILPKLDRYENKLLDVNKLLT